MTPRIAWMVLGTTLLASIVVSAVVVSFVSRNESTLPGLEAWSSYVYTVLTAWLVVGGAVAAVAVLRQLEEARLQREASLRPAVVLRNARREASDALPGDRLTIQLQNVGPGPALELRILAWIVNVDYVPTVHMPQHQIMQVLGKAKTEIQADKPGLQGRLSVVAASETVWISLLSLDGPEATVVPPAGVVVVAFAYTDVFGNALGGASPERLFARSFLSPSGRPRSPRRRTTRSAEMSP